MKAIIKKMAELRDTTGFCDADDIQLQINDYGWIGLFGIKDRAEMLIESWDYFNECEILKALDKLIEEYR